jgi:hypothetical protein
MRNMHRPNIYRSLKYASTVSRPDLAEAAGVLSRFISKWNDSHWKAAKHLFRYIRGTTDLCLMFDGDCGKRILLGYADADWGGDIDTRRSTTGYVFKSMVALLPGKVADNLRLHCPPPKQNRWRLLMRQNRQLGSDSYLTISNSDRQRTCQFRFTTTTMAALHSPRTPCTTTGTALLATSVVCATFLIGSNIAVWTVWERTTGSQGEWSGWLSSVLDTLAAVRLPLMMRERATDSSSSCSPYWSCSSTGDALGSLSYQPSTFSRPSCSSPAAFAPYLTSRHGLL